MRSRLDQLLANDNGQDQINDPGFVTSVKRGIGSTIAGVGEMAGDVTGDYNNSIRRYGEQMMERNPAGIVSTQDIASSPWLAVKEAAGSSVAPLLSVGLTRGAGRVAGGLGAGRTAAALRNPITAAEISGLPSYGEIGEAQRETGTENWAVKQGGALAVGAIENLGGVQRALGWGGGRGMTEAAAREFMATPGRSFGKAWLKMGAQEAGEEMLQTPIERGAGGRDAFDQEGMDQIGFGGAMGAIGGLALGPLGAAVQRSGARSHIERIDAARATLADYNAPYEDRLDAGQFLTRVMANDVNDTQAQAWWGGYNEALVQDRDAHAANAAMEARRTAVEQELQAVHNELLKADFNAYLREQMGDRGASTDLLDAINKTTGVTSMRERLPLFYGPDVPEVGAPRKQTGLLNSMTPAGQEQAQWWQQQGEGDLTARGPGYGGWWNTQDTTPYEARAAAQPGATRDLFSNEWRAPVQPEVAAEQDATVRPNRRQMALDLGAERPVMYAGEVIPSRLKVKHGEQPQTSVVFSQTPITDDIRPAANVESSPMVAAARAFRQQGGSKRVWDNFQARVADLATNPVELARALQARESAAGKGKDTSHPRAWQAAIAALNIQGDQNGQGIVQGAVGTNQDGYANPQQRDQSQDLAQRGGDQVQGDAGNRYGQEVARQEVNLPVEQQELRTRLAAATPVERQVILDVTGLDDEGMASGERLTYEAAGIKAGFPKGSAKQRVNQVLKKYKIDKKVLDRIAASSAAMPESVSAAELTATQGADGAVGSLDDAGFSTVDTPNESKVAEDRKTAIQTREANAWAAEQGADLTAPDPADNVETVEEQEIIARREAAAAKERARTDTPGEVEFDARWVDHRGQPIQRVDFDDAGLDWDSELQPGDPTFAELSEIDTLQWVRAWIAAEDKQLSPQELMRTFERIADGAKRQLQNNADVRPFEREVPGDAGGREARASGRAAGDEAVDPSGAARADEQPSDAAGEVTSETINDPALVESWWNKGARAMGVTPWEGLTEGQRRVLLNTETKQDFDETAQEIADDLNDAGPGQDAMYSEGAAGGSTVEAVNAAIKRLFTSPARARVVTVYATQAEAKAAGALSQDYKGRAQGFTHKGKVGIIAENVQPGQELAVLLHEVGVHLGMKKLVGAANMDAMIAQIDAWAARSDNSIETRVAKQAVERAANSSSKNKTEEKLAYMIEGLVAEGVTPTQMKSAAGRFMNRVWQAVRAALQQFGIGAKYDGQQLVDLAYGAANLDAASVDADISYSESPVFNAWSQMMTPDKAKGVIGNAWDKVKTLDLGWRTLRELAEHSKMPWVEKYADALQAMQRGSKQILNRASTVDYEWAQLDKATADRLSQVMRDATRAMFDPAVDKPTNEAQTALAKRYEGLPDKAKAVYVKARDFYADNRKQRQQIMEKIAADTSDAAVQQVIREYKNLKGPYFPLMRFGEFYTVAMSKELAALTAKQEQGMTSAAEDKRIAALRKDPAHYITRTHDKLSEAKADMAALQKRFPEVRYNRVADRRSSITASMPELERVTASLTAGMQKDGAAAIRDAMAQIYFDMLPEHHALKREMKREGVHGESSDMRRVFSASAIQQAHYISRLEHAKGVSEALEEGRRESTNSDATAVYNEIVKRSNTAMKQDTPNGLVSALASASYFAHLGLSPAFILTNMTQVPVVAYPWLAARYGAGAASRAIATGYADSTKIIKSTYKGKNWRAELDWSQAGLSGDEGAMLTHLLNQSLLDVTIEHDLTAVAESSHGKMNEYMKMANMPVHVTELMNRSTVALASYRLARSKGQAHDAAVKTAVKAVADTQLDYTGLNAARHMQTLFGSRDMARLAFQFRKFQHGMLRMIGRSIHDAINTKGVSAEDRAIARRQLAYLGATTWAFAGVLGMPLAGTVAWVIEALVPEDDDEPLDLEVAFRNVMTDMLGKEGASVVTNGLVGSLLGIDLTSRVGMGDIASPTPFARAGRTAQETTANYYAAAFGGAPLGTVADTLDGITKIASGDIAKGLEKALPLKLAQNLVRSERFSREGMSDSKGNTILSEDKFDFMDLAMRAAGFQTKKESDYYAANSAVMNRKEAANEVRTKLLRAYTKAKMAGEPTADVDAQIREFNKRHPEQGVRIDASTKLKSLEARRKMAKERTGSGLRADKSNKPYLDQARFAGE